MSLNNTPQANRIHIGIFGKRNAGKSSLINALTGQDLAIVSDIKGTTTDPVAKAMELLPIGPVVMIDTPGLDDTGELGALRVKKSYQILNKTDIVLLVVDSQTGMSREEEQFLEKIQEKNLPYLIVYNKCELAGSRKEYPDSIWVSALSGENIHELKEAIGKIQPEEREAPIVSDLIEQSDLIVLVVPVDSAAPKGRLILPQQQTIRDILEAGAVSVVVKETELKETLHDLGKKPKLVITDSQVFAKVAEDTPKDILLTSFSILFARYKGNLKEAVRGASVINSLETGDKVLIAEGCTHHRQCEDIGTVKLPRWLKEYTGKELDYSFTSGVEFPDDLSEYKLVIHCGACTLNEREMKYRIRNAVDQGVPITNYGIAIAYLKGILKRTVEPFPQIVKILEKEN